MEKAYDSETWGKSATDHVAPPNKGMEPPAQRTRRGSCPGSFQGAPTV